MSAVKKLVEYWNDFYKRGMNANQMINELLSPLEKYPNKTFGNVKNSVMDAIGDQSIYYPEPYFGFLDKMDPERDVLGLFMNPGSVNHEEVLGWNEEVIRQYTEWESENFLNECGVKDDSNIISSKFPVCNCFLKDRHQKGCNIWRRKRYLEIRRDFNLSNLRFLHTMEMFPFHSKVWDGRIKNHLEKMTELDFMKHTLNAVQELAVHRKVKCVLAVGQVWENIFDKKSDWYLVTKKQFSGSIGVRVIYYQATSNSSPIIVMVRRARAGVRFTENLEAQGYIRDILGTEKDIKDEPQDFKKIEKIVLQAKELDGNMGFKSENMIIEAILKELPTQINSLVLLKGKIYSPSKNKYKYIHLWFDNKPWHENYFSFHIHVYKDLYVEPKIEVRFGMNFKQLNISSSTSTSMNEKLTKIADTYGFNTKGKENVSFNVTRFCTGPNAIDEATSLLNILIDKVKTASEKVFNA